jgi:ribonuclease HII
MPNLVKRCDPEKYLQEILSLGFDKEDLKPNNYEIFRCYIHKKGEKLVAIGYKDKIMVQGGKGLKSFKELENFINRDQNASIEPKIIPNRRIHIGLDEAGKGEFVGSLFQSAVILTDSEIDYFNKNVKYDSKKLNEKQINSIYDLMVKKNVKMRTIDTGAHEIDENQFSINQLMDNQNIKLISKMLTGLNLKEVLIVIDDYETTYVMNEYLEKLRNAGCEIIIEEKADENYISAKMASIVAKKERNTYIEELGFSNKICIDGSSELTISNNYLLNREWLEGFLKLYPFYQPPHFIRRKWKDVKEIIEKFPRKKKNIIYECKCGKKNNLILFSKSDMEFYSSCCGEKIAQLPFINEDLSIMPDTSSLVSRSFSKIWQSRPEVLKGNCIFFPIGLSHEIDTLSKSLKSGANNEVKFLNELKNNGFCKLISLHYDITNKDIERNKIDYKISGLVAAENNCILITQDDNQATDNITRGGFSIRLLETPEHVKKLIKEKNIVKVN